MAAIGLKLPQSVKDELQRRKFETGASITHQVIAALADAWGWTGEKRDEVISPIARGVYSEDSGVDVLDRCT